MDNILSTTKLSEAQLDVLRPLEAALEQAVQDGRSADAVEITTRIQTLFPHDRGHHRLLQAKLWAFEACLNENRLNYAESGLVGVRKLSSSSTRLYLEATSLLSICMLRQKRITEAKSLIAEAFKKINNIKSDARRHTFQKALIDRINEESILTELIGTAQGNLIETEIHAKAVELIQRCDDSEIIKLIGTNIPIGSVRLHEDLQSFSLKQLPSPDRKLLPPPQQLQNPQQIGKTAFAILKRIAWKTFCKPSSTLYKLWSAKIPKVFNEGYFSAAVASTFADYRIGLPLIASGISALIMKYSAEEFCELAKPDSLMNSRREKAD